MDGIRTTRVSQQEAYSIITDHFNMDLKEVAEKYGRKVTTIKRVLDSPKYAAFKETCDEALQARCLEDLLRNAEDVDGE